MAHEENSLEILTLFRVRVQYGDGSPPGIAHLARRLLEFLTLAYLRALPGAACPSAPLHASRRRSQATRCPASSPNASKAGIALQRVAQVLHVEKMNGHELTALRPKTLEIYLTPFSPFKTL